MKKYHVSPDHGCKFKSMESFKSVTSSVQLSSLGKMTLIDTPGLNDPDCNKSDKDIYIEIIKNLSV